MSKRIHKDEPRKPESCPRCGASGLFPVRAFGTIQLNEDSPHGQIHKCPDIIEANRIANAEQVQRGKALRRERERFGDTTGNRVARWAWHGGATGDVEAY